MAAWEAFQAELEKKTEELFSVAVLELFKENPKLDSFSWTQYTPYFNDGEACEFGVYVYDTPINQIEGDQELTEEEEEAIREVVEEFLGKFNDTVMKAMFGEGVEVTVTRDDVEVTDYTAHD